MDFVQNYFSNTEKTRSFSSFSLNTCYFAVSYFYSKYVFSYRLSKIALVCLLNIPKLNITSLVELGRLTKQTDHNVDTVRTYIKGV